MELVHYVGECVAPCDWCDAIVVPPSPRLMELVHYVGVCVAPCDWCDAIWSPIPKTDGIGALCWRVCGPM